MKGYTSGMPLFDAKPAPPALEPVDPNVRDEDKPRLSRNNLAVLRRLQRGPVTTIELMGDDLGGIRPSARIHDLIKSGCKIESERVENGVARYTLTDCPEHLKPKSETNE